MRPRLFYAARRFDLSARQEEVLRLIASGRTNGEIARELGISLDGAKYHVREILGKLGADNREQAVAIWRASERPSRRVRSWGGALTGTWLRLIAAATGGLTVVAGLVVALALVRGGDGPATSTPAAAPTVLVAALERATLQEDRLSVWIYDDARPDSNRCVDILAEIVPAAAAGAVPARLFDCDHDASGYYFATDGRGLYLLGVAVLPRLKQGMAIPRSSSGTCDEQRASIARRSDAPETAFVGGFCEAQPLPRGVSGDPIVIRASIERNMAPDILPPPETPCWEFVRYFHAQRGGSELMEVLCTLE